MLPGQPGQRAVAAATAFSAQTELFFYGSRVVVCVHQCVPINARLKAVITPLQPHRPGAGTFSPNSFALIKLGAQMTVLLFGLK